jgi:hypothetical protein
VAGSTLAHVTAIADSTLGWTVGYLLVLAFLSLAAIPYLVARRLGGRRGAVLVVAWGILGAGLALAFGDLSGAEAVVAGALAFAGPWAVAAALGARASRPGRS